MTSTGGSEAGEVVSSMSLHEPVANSWPGGGGGRKREALFPAHSPHRLAGGEGGQRFVAPGLSKRCPSAF